MGGFASAIQFDLSYDNTLFGVSATAGDTTRNAGKELYFADVAPGQRRFLIAGLNQGSIPDGTLVNLFVNLNSRTPGGEYPLTVSGVVSADANGNPVATMGGSAVLAVQGAVGSASRLSIMGVLNGASLLAGPVAPGEIVTLMGSGIGPVSPRRPGRQATSPVIDGVTVLFDGTPSPILYAAPDQIGLIIPYEVYGEPVTQLAIVQTDTMPGSGIRPSKIVAALSVPVAAAAPAVFTQDASGAGSGAVLNQDSTVNTPSQPADKGSVVTIFATGAGQTDPPGVDGQIAGNIPPKPLLPVSVQIGGLNAQVLSAAAAPGFVAGILQVVCVVPANSPSGLTVPVLVTVGQASSQAGVSIAIR
jgi:uncharacterized protein (TIGR03437 family)